MNRLALAAALFATASFAEDLSPHVFQAELEKQGGLLLDVRTPGEVSKGKLLNASVIDFNAEGFERKVSLIARDRPVFVYCAVGGRSGAAAKLMTSKLGFTKVYNLAGGYRAWVAAGMTVETGGTAPVVSGDTVTPEAFDAALKQDKRVLVSFQTPWCTPCQKMVPVFDGLALEGVKRMKVDVDASEALAAREKLQGVPVFVLYVEGKEKARLFGMQPKEALVKLAATK